MIFFVELQQAIKISSAKFRNNLIISIETILQALPLYYSENTVCGFHHIVIELHAKIVASFWYSPNVCCYFYVIIIIIMKIIYIAPNPLKGSRRFTGYFACMFTLPI